MRTGIILAAAVAAYVSTPSLGETITIETSRAWSFTDFGFNNGFLTLPSLSVDRDDEVLMDNGLDTSLHELSIIRLGFSHEVEVGGYSVPGGGPSFVTFFSSIQFFDPDGGMNSAGTNTGAFTSSGSSMNTSWSSLLPMPDPLVFDGTGTVTLTPKVDSNLNGATGGWASYSGTFRVEYTWNVIPAPGAMGVLGLAGMVSLRRRRN
jgi:hypothetical protein